jgi:demethylmenaquinone methyltransferase/2-methoxy-6-polyprenyl-1,4-benzoquinol methylase
VARAVGPARGLPGASYDRISGAYDLVADRAEKHARDRGLELLQVRPGERVLEIGAGTGRALVSLAAAAGAGGEVCGLDVSSGMLEVARQRCAAGRLRVHLLRGDARSLRCRTAAFDAVFMSFTLEVFAPPDVARVLAEVQRVLGPGGRLGVVSLSRTAQPTAMGRAYSWLHRQLPHLVDCRPIDVVRHLERRGYRSIKTERLAVWGLPVIAALAGAPAPVGP